MTYLKLGDRRKALESLEKARTHSPDETILRHYDLAWEALSGDAQLSK